MTTFHDEIETWLAADLHGELAAPERDALHRHLVDCASCRRLHQENRIMDKLLQENLATEKADPTFEQRMLAGFRRRSPDRRGGVMRFLVNAMRSRATHIAAAAAVLLAMVQTGRILTGEGQLFPAGNRLQYFKGDSSPAALSHPARKNAALSAQARRSVDLFQPTAPAASVLNENKGKYSRPAESRRETSADERQPETEQMGGGALSDAAEAPGPNPVFTVNRTYVEKSAEEATANRKLIRNAEVEMEVESFEATVQRITAIATEARGYIATSESEKQENGKLKGSVVAKVAPENLDRFLEQLRGLGELKNQTLGTEDVTKSYFDTEARLKNARVMEERLIEMLKTKTGKVADLLAVEKELGRVREEIEKMQGELKFWDSQVQFATVTISIAEKDLDEPAAFLLKEQAQLDLFSSDVEKTHGEIKALASPKVQITNAQLNRTSTGQVSAVISLLIAPEESEAVIARVKSMARINNFQVQTDRVAQNGSGMSESAKTERDKVQLHVSVSREEHEQALQQTNLRIRTLEVNEKARELGDLAGKHSGRVINSSFSRNPDGVESANVSVRVPMKDYEALMQSLASLGKLENVSVHRHNATGAQIDEANAPADVSIHVYSQGNLVSSESGFLATLRRTIGQGVSALMWSLRMIGVALAFFAPWALAVTGLVWLMRVIRRRRHQKSEDGSRRPGRTG